MIETPRIMLIRHAEKPREGECGVAIDGSPSPQSLSVVGWQRAGALVRLFVPAAPVPPRSPILRPAHVFAARPTDTHPSLRPRETVTPLAQALGLQVDESWSDDDDPARVAAALRELQGPVLVCWRHRSLPDLADELLQRAEVPRHWPEQRFDLVWIVAGEGPRWTFSQLPQQLLPGDRTQSVPRRVPAAGVRR
ncbi:histidine phosphatase family protein [Rubrivivax gelatinosus]|nr:histidine phosphatase family protein [Rubrivivax gelatinosus]